MISHPRPNVLARNLRQLADRLDDTGTHNPQRATTERCNCLECRTQRLAARGWSTAVTGSDGGRSADPTTSTERAALNPGPYDDLDNRLARQLRLIWAATLHLHTTLDTVATHQCPRDVDCPVCADPTPVGTGTCIRCTKTVRPTRRRPSNRLRSGFCPACYMRWTRLGKPDRSTFIRTNNQEEVA